jgi:AraC family transcriptional regulator, regulatory protein of adaptative response / methylated-DNA-[protein]-cysteine methyltransferase
MRIVISTPADASAWTEPVTWTTVSTPYGRCLAAATADALCGLAFVDHPPEEAGAVEGLRRRWRNAEVREEASGVSSLVERLFADLQRSPPAVHLRGTPFQIRVWLALMQIPRGGVTTYGALAKTLGSPGSARAVGGAVGDNPIAIVIPCHRAVRATGALGGYRWGIARKVALLREESGIPDLI